MILYGFGRMFIEGLRTDSLMVGSLRISQILALAFVITFSVLFIYEGRNLIVIQKKVMKIFQANMQAVLDKLKEDSKENNDAVEEENIDEQTEEISNETKVDEVEEDIDKSIK